MGFFDRLTGRDEQPQGSGRYQPAPQYETGGGSASSSVGRSAEDEQALERYRYLLRTAPPERLEEAHAEAFAQLTPEQRRMVYEELSKQSPNGEAPAGDDPRSLAQSATRQEYREPGFLERTLGGVGGAGALGGFGATLGASLLGSVGGYVIGSSLMHAFLPHDGGAFDGGAGLAESGGEAGGLFGGGGLFGEGGLFGGGGDGGFFGGGGDDFNF